MCQTLKVDNVRSNPEAGSVPYQAYHTFPGGLHTLCNLRVSLKQSSLGLQLQVICTLSRIYSTCDIDPTGMQPTIYEFRLIIALTSLSPALSGSCLAISMMLNSFLIP